MNPEAHRTLDRESQKDRALGRLLAAARRGSAGDVEALAEVVERLLARAQGLTPLEAERAERPRRVADDAYSWVRQKANVWPLWNPKQTSYWCPASQDIGTTARSPRPSHPAAPLS